MTRKIADISKLAPHAQEAMLNLFRRLDWDYKVLTWSQDMRSIPVILDMEVPAGALDVWDLLEECDLV